MSANKLNAENALRMIEAAAAENRRVLGVDGFRIVPDGYVAALDLILDVSPDNAAEVALAKATAFIRANSSEEVVFELVIESKPPDSFPTFQTTQNPSGIILPLQKHPDLLDSAGHMQQRRASSP